MVKYFQCSVLFSIMLHLAILAAPGARVWWPTHGLIKIKCPYKKVNLSRFNKTVDPCPDLKQPICGTNFVTYDNSCILCVESLKSGGRIRYYYNGKC
ncbi:serine protease inhibitor Kazal-type 14 [Mus caroli]|uniref:Serine protease inhibitor Kazal-type 14 n=1 Tax=Mus caroli TaxID=10089 RepID=A0A6P5P391_MUSCR|nr:serine protease inhibitor Kazal-type 14 [Mus caroli]